MKKVLISLAAGAMVLGGALPVAAGGPVNNDEDKEESIWWHINDDTDVLEDLVLIAGMATMLDACGNGKPQYTLFAPIEGDNAWDAVGGIPLDLEDFLSDVLDVSVADLQATPAVVRALLNDHLVNGSFSPWQLELDEITTITARSGFTLRNENGEYINDLEVLYSEQACNGWVYFIGGVIDSTPQVATEGLNSLDTPKDGTPGGSNSLPDTL